MPDRPTPAHPTRFDDPVPCQTCGALPCPDCAARGGDYSTRELPRITCGACKVELYDTGDGCVYTPAGRCTRCGTSSFRRICDRCADELFVKEQAGVLMARKREQAS